MNDGFLVFVNVDEEGNITDSLTGYFVIPDRQYDLYFYLDEEINILEYKVLDRKLVKITNA